MRFLPVLIVAGILCCIAMSGFVRSNYELLSTYRYVAASLCCGAMLWSLLYTIKTMRRLSVKTSEKIFWISLAAVPFVFLVVVLGL
ncbi:MAG TPA: hypothetical protein VF676_02055 [Flavobacterium sp.]